MDDFIWRALLAGMGLVLIAGPLGCFIVWRRMAYFGDALSHSALLGVSVGVLLGISINISTIMVALLMAVLMLVMQKRRQLGQDTLLGIFSHTALALGLIVLSFLENVRVDLMAYLFGDILTVSNAQLWFIGVMVMLVLTTLLLIWRPLLSIAVDEDMARVEGVNVGLISMIYLLMLALLVAIAMKIVGILLITAMLIIPAATARQFARTPAHMVLLASALGLVAVVLGLAMSLNWDTPTGPSMIIVASALFILSLFKEALIKS